MTLIIFGAIIIITERELISLTKKHNFVLNIFLIREMWMIEMQGNQCIHTTGTVCSAK